MQDDPMLAIPLTIQEQEELQQYEAFLKEKLHIFFDVGNTLLNIRNKKLYREQYRTFEEYCRERWNISRPRAYQLMDAATIREDLSTTCKQTPLPQHEVQTRALKAAPQEKRAEVWQKAIAKNDGRAPTGRQIVQVIETEFEEKKPTRKAYTPGEYYQTEKVGVVKITGEIDSRGIFVHCEEPDGTQAQIATSMFQQQVALCDGCHTYYPVEQITEYNGRRLHTDCYYAVLRAEHEADNHQPTPNIIYPPVSRNAATICAFCGEAADKLYQSELHAIMSYPAGVQRAAICRKCAGKAQIALLHTDDPEVIVECQQMEHDLALGNSDRDKIMRVGLRQFRPVYSYLTNGEREILLKEYTPSNGTSGVGFGSWKTVERFSTKKALQDRIKTLEKEPDAILDGGI